MNRILDCKQASLFDMHVGIDLEMIDRFRHMQQDSEFFKIVFLPRERNTAKRSKDPIEYFSSRFAAKEAIIKALGGFHETCVFSDIEIISMKNSCPNVILHKKLKRNYCVRISMTHSTVFAAATAVAWKV